MSEGLDKDSVKISKADIFLLAGIILLCGIILLSFYVFKTQGLTADIMISGETVKTVRLDETAVYIIYSVDEDGGTQTAVAADGDTGADSDAAGYIENYMVDGKSIYIVKCNAEEAGNIVNVDSYNVILVEENSVNVIDADCPDKVCVNHSDIGNVGETIICLPHKMVVEIKEK